MTDKSPAFQFYPGDFLSDENVAAMSLEERGAYITLLCYCWKEGSIPAETKRIARLLGVRSQVITRLWPGLEPCFREASGKPGRLVNPRLERERRKQVARRKKLSEAGKKGADARHGDGQATARPVASPSLSSSSSSSPSGEKTTASRKLSTETVHTTVENLSEKMTA